MRGSDDVWCSRRFKISAKRFNEVQERGGSRWKVQMTRGVQGGSRKERFTVAGSDDVWCSRRFKISATERFTRKGSDDVWCSRVVQDLGDKEAHEGVHKEG